MQKSKIKNQKFNIRKGDTVYVLSGRDKGKKGKVLRVISKSGKVVVEGVNIIKKHQKPTQSFQGGIIERPGALSLCKLKVVCTRCGKPTRIKKSSGSRICRKCGEVIDKT